MIIQEYRTPAGVHIQFNNAAFAEKTAEEKAALRYETDKVAAQIILNRAKGE